MGNIIIQSDIMAEIREAVRDHISQYQHHTEDKCARLRRYLHRLWVCLWVVVLCGCCFSFLRSLLAHYGWGDFIPICISVIVCAVLVGLLGNVLFGLLIRSTVRRHTRIVATLEAFVSEDWYEAKSLLRSEYVGDQFVAMYVGICQLFGLGGFEKSANEAVLALKRLCEMKVWPAFYILGRAYELGIGVEEDRVVAGTLLAEGARCREGRYRSSSL